MTYKITASLVAALGLFLAGCDQVNQRLGLEDPARKEAKADAEGRAVGSACRQSGRAIEDCYAIYNWLPKSSVFAGWRDMNDYMQERGLQVVEPKLPPALPDGKRRRKPDGEDGKIEAEVKAEKAEKSESTAKPAAEVVATGKAAKDGKHAKP